MNGDVTPAYLGICIISIPEQIISTAWLDQLKKYLEIIFPHFTLMTTFYTTEVILLSMSVNTF
jgi:hypothetical protein